jgi:hypothetical protein
MFTIGSNSAYATIHRSLTVAQGSNALGVLKVAALSSDEQAWLVDLNNRRATVSVPASFGNLKIDEFAEEEARAEAASVAAGTNPYADSTEGIFGTIYDNTPGVYFGVSGVSDLQNAPSAFVAADAAFYAEMANCPAGGDWQTCPLAENTGHYMVLSDTRDVWIGLGESATPMVPSGQWPGFYAYAGLVAGDGYGTSPNSINRRTASFAIRR